GHQLHAVVGGERLAAGKLLLARARANDDAPAAGARIALAGPVGEHLDFGQRVAHAASRPAGSLNTIRSSTPSTGSSVTSNRSASAATTSRTSTSGAEAPAVMPSVRTPSSQPKSRSAPRPTKRALVPSRSATSTRRSELEL